MEKIKVVLADDHVVVRSGIKNLLENEGDIVVVGEASNGKEALEVVEKLKPDMLIIDIRMPEMNGLEATRELKNNGTSIKILILSMHDDEDYILQSIECGASGYLLKDTSKEEFLKAIKAIHQGGKYFSGDISQVLVNNYLNGKDRKNIKKTSPVNHYDVTKREKQILKMIASGIGNKEIAEKLGKSIRTIETHRFNIMKKLKVNNVVELLKRIDEDPGLKDHIET
ncbi:response regulator transcription factor [Cyclobacterium qasimii]|uniref:DNA-binding response regulator, LuxR family n=2 Tax=Cyclobacterium qasimii TaxID=1350429 RepID=S7WFR2_9BACT|nr:response regulator [Cyclobacterium qasimii]EPR65584.1 DNA-binding response regulator, LuxR family [Cyclobacterium qasimii M12-11B]GEO19566.1 DNA-binding response regulator [Cyclobacterium qasimii]